VVAADACRLGLRRERRHDPCGDAERTRDAVEQRDRHVAKARRPAEQREQPLALLARRDRFARAAYRQDAVAQARVVEAVRQESGEVVVADRFARRERAVGAILANAGARVAGPSAASTALALATRAEARNQERGCASDGMCRIERWLEDRP